MQTFAQSSPIAIDFSGLANVLTNALVGAMEHLLSPLPIAFEQWLLEGIQSLLFSDLNNLLIHMPIEATTQAGDVLDLWRKGLLIQATLAAVVLMVGGYRVMHGTADIWEVVGKTVFLMIVGESVILWATLIFDVINFASNDVFATPLDIREENLPNDLTMGITLIIAAILALLAWIKGAVGVVFIKVLLVSAPYLLPLSAIPKLEGLALWWIEEFTTWTLRPFMVALVLRLGLGIAINNTGGLQFLFAIVSFWLAYTMDTRIRRFSVGAWGSIAQAGMFARGARTVAGLFTSHV